LKIVQDYDGQIKVGDDVNVEILLSSSLLKKSIFRIKNINNQVDQSSPLRQKIVSFTSEDVNMEVQLINSLLIKSFLRMNQELETVLGKSIFTFEAENYSLTSEIIKQTLHHHKSNLYYL
jgi:hypothetical protein